MVNVVKIIFDFNRPNHFSLTLKVYHFSCYLSEPSCERRPCGGWWAYLASWQERSMSGPCRRALWCKRSSCSSDAALFHSDSPCMRSKNRFDKIFSAAHKLWKLFTRTERSVQRNLIYLANLSLSWIFSSSIFAYFESSIIESPSSLHKIKGTFMKQLKK